LLIGRRAALVTLDRLERFDRVEIVVELREFGALAKL
jgi:hypothetical protein